MSLASEDNARVLDFSPLPSRTSNFPEGSQFDIADFEGQHFTDAQAGPGQHVDQRDIALSAPMRAIHSVDELPQIARVQRIYWLLVASGPASRP